MSDIFGGEDEVMRMTSEEQERRLFRRSEDRITRAVGHWPDLEKIRKESLSVTEIVEVLKKVAKRQIG
jgi:hypothetical protein